MYSSTIRRGRIFHFRADKATLTSQGTNSPQISAPLDWSGNYTPSIVNSSYTTTSGWSGTGTTLDPYRLVLDGVNDYLDTKHIPQLTDKWSMELWIKIPDVVSKETNTIWGTNGTGNGYWMPGFSYSKSNKKLAYGHDYYGNPTFEYGTIADHVINPGDIIQIGLVFDGCKHVQLYLNGILLMDSTFTLTPTATSSNLIGGNIPTTAYYGYGNIEVISCSIFSKLLSATEILRSYQGNEDPLYKTSLSQMNRGDYISCRYTALTSGQAGTFSELGTCTSPEIPVAGTTTPDGKFYLIMAGYDSQGRKKLVADRNIQTGISWDTLNSAGICSGININIYNSKLISFYKFNESLGSTCLDELNKYNGTYTGTTSIIDSNGTYRSFNGTSDYISFSNPVIPLGKKTIKFKIKVNGNPSTVQFLFTNQSGGSFEKGLRIALQTSGKISFSEGDGSKYINSVNIISSKVITDNNWHDVIYAWDGTTNENGIKIYIDDFINPDATFTATSTNTGVASANFMIGKPTYTNNYYFNGSLDEIEIYNDVISQDTPTSLSKNQSIILRSLTGGTSSTDKDNEWDKIIGESTLGGTITPGDDNVWHWKNLYSLTSTTPINGVVVGGSTSNNTHRVLRGYLIVDFFSFIATNDTRVPYGNFRPVMLVEDTSAPVVTVTKYMIQQDTNIFDINPANYSITPTKISDLHVVESLSDAIIEQSGGGWDDVVNYLSLFKGTKYKILKFVRNE